MAAQATATEAPVTLDYDAGAASGCPAASDFRRMVTRQLGHDPFQEGESRRVVVRVVSASGGLGGSVEWQDGTGTWQGEQRFESRNLDCSKLTKSMGFAVVVQIQLLDMALTPPVKGSPTVTKAPPRTSSPAPAPTSAPLATKQPANSATPSDASTTQSSSSAAKPPATAPTPAAATPPSTPIDKVSNARAEPRTGAEQAGSFWVGGVGPALGLGVVPGVTLEGRVFGGWHGSHVSFELGAEGSWPSTFQQADGSGFSHRLLAFTLAACADSGRWSACALGKLGNLRVEGKGVDEAHSSSGILAQAGLRVAIVQMLGERVFVQGRLEGLGQLKPWTVTLNQTGVFTTPLFASIVGIDIGMRFP